MNITNSTVNIDNVNAYNNTTPIPSKVCTKCNQIKPLTEYRKNKLTSDGLQNDCKSCKLIIDKRYRDNNKQINANKIYNENDVKICSKCKLSKPLKEYQKDITKSDGFRPSCKQCDSIINKHYRNNIRQMNANRIFTENDVRICSTCKQQKLYTEFYKSIYEKSGLESYCKDCIANDPKTQFRQDFFKAINKAFKSNNNNCLKIIGCDSHFLKLWFEFQFDDKMNWNNHGSYFHIDYVKPCALFNIEDINDRRLMNHWSNLQTLEKYENMSKHNKYNDEIELNHTTKILRFLDHLDKTNPDLCKFATESYSNLY